MKNKVKALIYSDCGIDAPVPVPCLVLGVDVQDELFALIEFEWLRSGA